MALPMIQGRPGLGALIGGGLGQGAEQGLSAGTNYAMQLGLQKAKMMQNLKIAQEMGLLPQTPSQTSTNQLALQKPQTLTEGLFPSQQKAPQVQQQEPEQQIDSKKMYQQADFFDIMGQHGIAEGLRQRAKTAEEREFIPQKAYVEYGSKRNAEFLDKVDLVSDELPVTDFNIALLEDAAVDANKWAAARDTLAEKTGYEGFRSGSGAEMQSAIKNYFLSDLSSVKGGRPNVLIEQQLLDAYPKSGRDPISNQKIILGMKLKKEIQNLQVEEANKIKEKFTESGKGLPVNFKDMVQKSLKSKVPEIEKKYIKTLKLLTNIERERNKIFRSYVRSGEYLMMSPEGQPFAVPKKELQSYREQGYIPLGEK